MKVFKVVLAGEIPAFVVLVFSQHTRDNLGFTLKIFKCSDGEEWVVANRPITDQEICYVAGMVVGWIMRGENAAIPALS